MVPTFCSQLLSLLLGEEIVGPHPAPLFDEEMMIGAHSFPVLWVEMMVPTFCSQFLSLLLAEEIVEPHHPAPLCGESTIAPFLDLLVATRTDMSSLSEEGLTEDLLGSLSEEEITGVYTRPLSEGAGFHSAASLGTETPGDLLSPLWQEIQEMARAHPPPRLEEKEEEITGVYTRPLSEGAGFHSAASLGTETPGDLLSPLWQEMAGAHPPPRLEEKEEEE